MGSAQQSVELGFSAALGLGSFFYCSLMTIVANGSYSVNVVLSDFRVVESRKPDW